MRKLFLIYLLLFSTLQGGFIQASTPECVFEHYSSLDGLPHNSISDIYKDRKGFIWICTWYGISRFDGYTFKNYRTLPGDYSPLSHNRFTGVTEDVDGYLWITTYDNRLYRFDRNRETFQDIPRSFDEYSDKDYKINDFLNSSSGHTWISLSGHGLMRVFKSSKKGEVLDFVSYQGNSAVGSQIGLIFEDSKGRVYVVSEIGITMFAAKGDDYVPTLISRESGVQHIAEQAGRIYCGAERNMIVFDDNGKIETEILIPNNARITALEPSKDSTTLFIGTDRAGILQYDTQNEKLDLDNQTPGRIRDLVADSKGLVWVTTARNGIYRYKPKEKDYKHFEQSKNVVAYYLDTLTRVVEAGDRLWIKMNGVGFGYYDHDVDELKPFYNTQGERFTNGVPCFTIDSTNILWMSTTARGLEKITIIDKEATVFTPPSVSDDRASSEIRALLLDSKENIWMAAKSGELFCYDSNWQLKHQFPNSASGYLGMIYGMKEDSQGNIWLGTKGNGVIKLTPSGDNFSFTNYHHDPNDRYSLSDDQIYSIEEDYSRRIWFGTYGGGISMLESPDSERFITPFNSLPNYPVEHGDKVRYVHCAPDSTMLVGTVEGLITFKPKPRPEEITFKLIQKIPGDANSLGNNDVIHILSDSKGQVWLSTFGGGLNKLSGYDEKGNPRFEIYSTEDGLSSNIVFAATEDLGGDIWLSTENGISRLNVNKGRFSNYSKYDGIPPATFSEATAVTTSNGEVLFGSLHNLYVIRPSEMSRDSENSMLAFTNLRVDNEDVVVGNKSPLKSSMVDAKEVRLPYDYSVFRIEFASLNFRLQPKLSYMYKLDGFDKEWSMAKDIRSASYSNVPHGKYLFRVKTLLEGEGVNSDEISILINVGTPPWKSSWAYLIYAILISAIVFGVLRTLYTMISLRNKVSIERQMTDLKIRFFTNISHELRTPLTLIVGGVDDVKKRERLSERGEYNINIAQKNAKRMLNLINQLLDFRKIVNTKMDLKISRRDIIPLGQSVLEDFKEMAAERNIELMFSIGNNSLPVWVDPQRIEGVIYNLLANAFKFTPNSGKITLAISHTDGDDYFTIAVTDTGVGIPKEKQEKIFERFVQVGATQEGVAGSGIGLALSKEIVELHHGVISVESTPGVGSTFSVRLKMGNSHFNMADIDFREGEQAYMTKSEYLTIDSEEYEEGRSDQEPPEDAQKILLVEDNHELRIFLYNNLIESYEVIEAIDGVDAIEKITNDAPDIIITDLMMPRKDGHELINEIRNNFETSHIPIIMLTAKDEVGVRTKAMKYGADGYITKPFSMELLLARIDNLLTQRRTLFEHYSSKRPHVIDLEAGEVVVTDRDREFIEKVDEWIEANMENSQITVDDLASHLAMGRTTMYNKIKGLTQKSPIELIRDKRIKTAKEILRSGQYSVSETAYKVGFSDPGYFSKCFREYYKMSPAEFIRSVKEDKDD